MVHFEHGIGLADVGRALTDDGPEELADFLARHDILVNCVLQDPASPMMFLTDADLPRLKPRTVIVDVSCDAGMGFSWARPTTFEEPTFVVGDEVIHYGVDHSLSLIHI